MTYIQIIILCTMIVYFFLNLLSFYLNLKNLKEEIPKGFEDYFDREKYKKSQKYIYENARLEIIEGLFSLSVFLIFWFVKGFGYLDKILSSLVAGEILRGIIYIGILIVAKSLLDLPFSLYSTFVIEEKFGFNKTSFKLYFSDKIKMLFISSLIGIPLIGLILVFFKYFGGFAWLFCWIVVTCFILAMQIIVPVWIMPFFNKFNPLEDGELKKKVMDYASANNFPLENVFVMDGSRRSQKSNAFFSGFGKTKRLVLFDTIIEKHSPDEIVSIVAHETGHYKKKHILISTFLGVIQAGVMFYLLSFFISFQDLFDAFYVERVSVYAGLVFFGFLYSPVDFFVSMIMLAFSRKNEYEADRFAVETTGNKKVFADTLKRLSADNYSNLSPHPLHVFFNYSHPPVSDRVKRIYDL
ncbi:MAG: M48 family metallopeptidase [Desulfobacteraceae bacterium]|nr:M48 family metallopeptidase [Desulfobacteraceae bacterium]MCB9495011.1 M48 family metallopeptidase [Desulfobacteraceae bacterium]